MEQALCTIDGIRYNAKSFSMELQRDESFGFKRRNLLCIACKGKAFFRSRSRNNRDPHFGANHKRGCTISSGGFDRKPDEAIINEVQVLKKEDGIIEVFFAGDVQGNTNSGHNEPRFSRPVGKARKRYTKAPGQTSISKKGLGKLLSYLINSDDFSESDILIKTGRGYAWKAKNLFIELSQVNHLLYKKLSGNKKNYRAFWGLITDADPDMTWLNTARSGAHTDSVSILLPSDVRQIVLEQFQITCPNDLEGAYVLVFGYLNKSGKSEKLFIRPERIDTIFIMLNGDDKNKMAASQNLPNVSYSESSNQDDGLPEIKKPVPEMTNQNSTARHQPSKTVPDHTDSSIPMVNVLNQEFNEASTEFQNIEELNSSNNDQGVNSNNRHEHEHASQNPEWIQRLIKWVKHFFKN